MKYNRTAPFLKGSLKQVKSNKGRFILTVSGIILASILFLTANIVIKTYVNSLYDEARKCSREGVVVTGNLSEDIWLDMNMHFSDINKNIFFPTIGSFAYIYNNDKLQLNVIPMIVGTGNNFLNYPIYSIQGYTTIFESKIVEGRDISKEDLLNKNRVVVISEQAEHIIFGKESAIGKNLELSLNDSIDTENFQIIGVYKNSMDEQTNSDLISYVTKKKMASTNILINCYIPYTIYKDYSALENVNIKAVVFDTGTNLKKKEKILGYYSTNDLVEVDYKEKKISQIDYINKDTLLVTHILMIVMMVIAGLNLFNSIMFSIRERVSEIGIRKAVGATNAEILKQFMIEGIVTTLIGGFFSAVIVTILVTGIQIWFNRFTVMNVKIIYTFRMLIEMMCYEIIMGLIFSIIPAIIAAKTKVIDAIRFD